MPSKLDRSQGKILAKRLHTNRRRGNKAAVAGGIRKHPQRAATQKAYVSGPSGMVSTSKIIVSNLVCATLVATYHLSNMS